MQTTPQQNPVLAAGLIVSATVFIALSTLLAKSLGTGRLGSIDLGAPVPVFQISFGRYLFAFIAIVSACAVLRLRVQKANIRLHAGRTMFGWCGVTLMFAAVAYIPMADATAISFLNPVFCMFLAIPFLGERVGPWRWAAAVIALVGALVLLRPGAGSFQPEALLALGAAAALGAELILIKRLAGRERPLQILVVNNFLGLLIATLAALFVWQSLSPLNWLILAGVGFSMAAAQACFVNGMARADASFVAPFSYSTLVFAAFMDALVFGVIPDRASAMGAAIILAGAALLAWREARAATANTDLPQGQHD